MLSLQSKDLKQAKRRDHQEALRVTRRFDLALSTLAGEARLEPLFVLNFDGVVYAFDAKTGDTLWKRRTSFNNHWYPPVTGNGLLYVVGDNLGLNAYGLDQVDGHTVWRQAIPESGPTLSKQSIFFVTECNGRELDATTGEVMWQDNAYCSNVPDISIPYYSNRLYPRYWDLSLSAPVAQIRDATNGSKVGRVVDVVWPPVFNSGIAYYTGYRMLRAVSVDTGKVLWRASLPSLPPLAPIVINGKVILVSSTGVLSVLDGGSGKKLQSLSLGIGFSYFSGVLAGFGAGQGMLLVPFGDYLFAFKAKSP